MSNNITKFKTNYFERFASSVSKITGSTTAFTIAFFLIIVWGICGPIFHFSENWQIIINTVTSVITFLMVFLIQKAQNKDSLAIHLKLNELVAAHSYASNRLIDVEGMTEEELKVIQKYYRQLNEFSKKEESLQQSHSIDEAHELHEIKKEMENELNNLLDTNKMEMVE